MPLIEGDVVDPGTVCQKCERTVERLELEKCPVCGRQFCSSCRHRAASRNFCGRPCGDAFFFGGDFDGESVGEED